MLNKKGYIMIYVIGIISVLMILTTTLTSITLTRSNWSREQVNLIQDSAYAKAIVEAAANDMAIYFESLNNLPNDEKKYLNDIINDLQNYFDIIRNQYNVEIIPNNFTDTSKYSYELLIKYDGIEVSAEKKVFLSMMPSFLFFTLGSNTDLNINGGAYIDGNIYIDNNFYITNTANYILNNNRLSQATVFPTINNGTIFFSSNNYKINSCFLYEECFNISQGNFLKQNFGQVDLDFIFNDVPIIRNYPNNFLEVDFDEAFLYYIKKDIITDEYINNYPNIDINNLDNLFIQLYEDGIIENYFSKTNTKSTLINNDFVIDDDLEFTQSGIKEHWIIVNGDLEIKNYNNNDILNINANILVTGDITITGYVKLNSIIYALGKGTIHNANINVNVINDNDQLVLLTKENLKFSKINEFDNRFLGIEEDENHNIKINPTIKGFFYTDSFVEIYTVNSYLSIEGGIFSNDTNNKEFNDQGGRIINNYITNTDSIGLLINSYQGEVTDNQDGTFNFNGSTDFKNARFLIKHSTNILETQPKGLPLTKDFNFLFEETIITKLKK